jgi:hypothetical protein
VVPKPWHVDGKDLGPGVRSLLTLQKGAVHAGRSTSTARHETCNRQN